MNSSDNSIVEMISYLKSLQTAALAFSGGVDSTLLLYLLKEAGLEKMIAVTVLSSSYTDLQKETVLKCIEETGVEHYFIDSCEMADKNFLENTDQRCYYCKHSMFTEMKDFAAKKNIYNILEASHVSDLDDHRPGLRAIREFGVISPFINNAWTKEKIKAVSEKMHIPGSDRGPTVCLSSRVPYGTEITEELINKIAHAEKFLISKGFRQVRVRSDGSWVRIEVEKTQIERLSENDLRAETISNFRKIGFDFISLDMEGYVSGKMNRLIK